MKDKSMKNIKQTAAKLQQYGRNGDTMLAHITPQEADVLKQMGGSGTINPKTGLPEYFLDKVVGAATNIVGGLMGGSKAADAAKGQAEALRAAAERAYQMSKFNPIGMKTGLGESYYKMGEDGRLTEAGYKLDPKLQAIQSNLFGLAGSYDPTQVAQAAQPIYGGASSLFNLGQQYLATSPEEAAAKYMSQQQALLAGDREAQLAAIRNQQIQTGRTGLATGGTVSGMAATNPEMAAYYNALAKQDLQLAAAADQAGMERVKFGAGLFGTGGDLLGMVPKLTTAGYAPLEAQLGLIGSVEKLGQQPFMLSNALAEQESAAGARAAQLYLQPQAAAAQAYSQYQGYSPGASLLSGIGSAIGSLGGLGGGGSSWFGNLIGSNAGTAVRYGTNIGSQQTNMLQEQERGLW